MTGSADDARASGGRAPGAPGSMARMPGAPAGAPFAPADDPRRAELSAEIHARPIEARGTPSAVAYWAVMVGADARGREEEHVADLCRAMRIDPPRDGANHFVAELGDCSFKWERHGEFSGYMVSAEGDESAVSPGALAARLPPGWLGALPGRTMVAAFAELVREAGQLSDAAWLATRFGAGAMLVGADVSGGAGIVFSDYRIDAQGFVRFVVADRGLTPRQAGRVLQRLFEIETYRMMALLALPVARGLGPVLGTLERELSALTDRIAAPGGDDERLLVDLTALAGEVERQLAATQFRFGACRAYHELVRTRIGELREGRLPGMQTIAEFMERRYSPAIATCQAAAARLSGLSERVSRASALLTTRVEIASEKQNQALLMSMDRRARLQLRLQQTVEGLSVAAITYYLAGLVGYLAKGAKAAGMPVDPDLAAGIAVPLLVVAVLIGLKSVRRRLHDPSNGHDVA